MRTSARQVSGNPATPFVLADARCSVCACRPVVILATGRNGNGAIERHYCGFAHATLEGWPWLGEAWRRGDDLFTI
jgi:hypothetical protein